MARKLAGVVFAVSTMHASVVQALGLGDIDMKSSINQPLRAQIAVLNTAELEASQLSVRLAGQEAFERAGVERGFFLSDLTFTVQFDGKGGGVIQVVSEKPVREPFIDFVLEARWPEGHLVREYTLLVDLPEFAEGAVVAAVPPPASTEAARIQPPVPAGSAANSAKPNQIVTRRSDTLWEIAARVKPGSVNMQQAMMALLERNPQAFEQRNINRLRKGQVMHLPSDSEYRALTADAAIMAVARQNAEWRAGQADAGDSVATAGSAAAGDKSYMKLSGSAVAKPGVNPTAADGGEVAAATSAPQQAEVEALRSKITVAEERLDSAERENVEMNDRLGELEQQIDTLMELVEMKNRQLANLQTGGAATLAPGAVQQNDASAGGAAGGSTVASAGSDLAGIKPDETTAAVAVAASVPIDQNYSADPVAPPINDRVAAPEAQPESLLSLSSPLLWSVAGGIGVIAAAGGLVVHRRRREEAAIEAAEEALVAEEARASLKARAVGATAEAGSVVDADALLANEDNSEPLMTLDRSAPVDSEAGTAALDPMTQAEAMCAEGRHDQAIDVLRQALATDPARSEIHLQLLGVLAELDREEAYKEAFAALESCDQDAAFMARHLVADKGWLDAGDGEPGAAPSSEPSATSALAESESSIADAPAADLLADAELELDLNLDLGELGTPSLELENDSLGDLPGESELKFDLGSFDADESDAPVDLGVDLSLDLADGIETQAGEAAGSGSPAGADAGLASLLDAGLDDEMQGMLDTDAISTKLELARAYVDMGDVDGARDILEEVLQEGSEGQKGEANELLSAIAS